MIMMMKTLVKYIIYYIHFVGTKTTEIEFIETKFKSGLLEQRIFILFNS